MGPQGPVGPAGAGAPTIEDANGSEIGTIELSSRLVARRYGDDQVLLAVSPQGFLQGDITFYHTTTDCSGDRFLANNGGVFAYYGWVSSGTVFYTKLADGSAPVRPEPFLSAELVTVGDNPAVQGSCSNGFSFYDSMGKAVMVNDPAISSFAVPFRLK